MGCGASVSSRTQTGVADGSAGKREDTPPAGADPAAPPITTVIAPVAAAPLADKATVVAGDSAVVKPAATAEGGDGSAPDVLLAPDQHPGPDTPAAAPAACDPLAGPDAGAADPAPAAPMPDPLMPPAVAPPPPAAPPVPRAGADYNDEGDGHSRLVLAQPPTPATPTSAIDPAVTPSGPTATVMLLAPSSAGGGAAATREGGAKNRYASEADLSVAGSYLQGYGTESDDDDELEALFSLQAWKRFYGYNRKKHSDLLSYFWRKFNSTDYSLYCLSYRAQHCINAPHQAEAVCNGYCARLEDAGLADALFAQVYALYDFDVDAYYVLGLLLVQGGALPPALLAMAPLDHFSYSKADPSVAIVRQFLSALIIGKSPLNTLQLVFSRECF